MRDTAGLGIREHSYPVGSQPQVLTPLGSPCSKDDVTSPSVVLGTVGRNKSTKTRRKLSGIHQGSKYHAL